MKCSRLLIVLLALVAPVLTALAPDESYPPPSSPPQQVCSIYDTTAYASDHIAWELGQCWETWTRLPHACTKTSVYTVTLDDPSRQVVVNALDPADTIDPPNTQAKCTGRHITLLVERELESAPGIWATIGNYTTYGDWNVSRNTCWTALGWTPIAISSGTARVRLTAQTIRSNGTFAGTNTVAGYITPAGVEPCVDL
jgi:hypothetical protein